MKASILRKEILSLVVLFVCSLAMSAASPRNYLYDTKEENGKIVSKVISTGRRAFEQTGEI